MLVTEDIDTLELAPDFESIPSPQRVIRPRTRVLREPRPLTDAEKKCFVCLEDGDTKCRGRHLYHPECLSAYLSHSISEGAVKLACPVPGCTRTFLETDLDGLVSEADLEKFKYFCHMRRQPNAIRCPKCQVWQTGNPRRPDMVCNSTECGHAFCFAHGNAHLGVTCARSGLGESFATRLKIKAWELVHTHSCPACGVSIQKNGGCPNMVCTSCNARFCWWCRCVVRNGSCSHWRLWAIASPVAVPLGLAIGSVMLPVIGVAQTVKYIRKKMRRRPVRQPVPMNFHRRAEARSVQMM
eukprot:TRINITY_DN850_c0_g1_i2.p1 TRINITY_DN850_c0_g1~~TRINITY_DN850_c0_g1_i2.p1  ORF type:complete len:305 (-),score=35.88 TRINITY_DN850_c0_g1_i2:38-928(-)